MTRLIHHQKEERIEAHICGLHGLCPAGDVVAAFAGSGTGINPPLSSVLEKYGSGQMVDVHLPATEGRKVTMLRYTPLEPELQILLR